MKGTIFQRPLELRLSIDGEGWAQGDSVSGVLTVKNHGAEPLALGEIGVSLARGSLRKVRAKSDGAFEPLGSKNFAATDQVAAGAEATLEWSFPTERNCPITDSLASLFMVYGREGSGAARGQLELPIHPHALILEYIKTLQIQFRFVEKARKMCKGRVEFKLAPPSSQAFASLDHVLVSFHFDGDALDVAYCFNLKKLEATASSIEAKKDQRVFEQKLGPTQYHTSSGRVNHEVLEKCIRAALDGVEKKVLF